jgi:GT2 family glycosyltransferase
MRVCTIVVTFNRYTLLKECIDALLAQSYPTDILIVDNASTDETPQRLQKDGYLKEASISLLQLTHNSGGAGGFYAGMQEALEKNYDYVWLMDDDAEPAKDALEILMHHLDDSHYSGYAPALFSGTKEEHSINIAGHRCTLDFAHPLPMLQKPIDASEYQKKRVEIEMASFVGLLVSKEMVQKVGLPKREFFIHYDDTEYCVRLNGYGEILLLPQSKIYHKEKRQEEKEVRHFLWMKKQRIRFDKLWIKYFGVRNSIYLAKKYATNPLWIVTMMKNYLLLIKDILLFDDHKCKRIRFATSSYLDGLRGAFDNDKPRKILS